MTPTTASSATASPVPATLGWSTYTLLNLTWATYTLLGAGRTTYDHAGEVAQQSTMGTG